MFTFEAMKRLKSIIYFFGTIAPMLLFSCNGRKVQTKTSAASLPDNKIAFYDISLNSLVGSYVIKMADFKGKKILIVNVASKCGYTSQYKDLEELNKKYGDKLVVLGCPCNQFMGQEPGSAEEIAQFCSSTYDVSFALTEKLEVLGDKQHPLYKWLTQKTWNQKDDYKVTWNFNKFLIDENGNLIAYFGSKTNPMSEDITSLL